MYQYYLYRQPSRSESSNEKNTHSNRNKIRVFQVNGKRSNSEKKGVYKAAALDFNGNIKR